MDSSIDMRRSKLLLLAFALGGCIPSFVVIEEDSEGSSTGDSSSGDPPITTTAGPTTSPPPPTTITTADPDTGTGFDTEGCVCPPGLVCIRGVCFDCPPAICDRSCAPNEECLCPPGDECCEFGTCVPLDCPTDPLPGNYHSCLDAMGVPDDGPCDGAPCITDDETDPSVSVCMPTACDLVCQCPPGPGTGTAPVVCEDVTGDLQGDCWLDCQGGGVCPDGMACFGGFICVWDPINAPTPLYGDCFNGSAVCEDGTCLEAPDAAVCSAPCNDVGDCQPAPATGNAIVECDDITNDGVAECWLGCQGGETCPDGMTCWMDFICLWPEILPPSDAYGDCVNSPGTCEPGEDACLTGGGAMPTAGACSHAGCASAMDCPAPPPTGDAPAACGDFGDGSTCYLDCSMGQTCPSGTTCTNVGMGMGPGSGMACLWPIVPPDFTCTDGDLGSAMGPGVAMGTIVGGGDDYLPSCSGGGNDEDVQLRWTAPADGTYTFDTVGSNYDTILMIHPDCVGPELVCNDDTMALLSEVTLDIAAGQSVLIVIDGWNEAGNYVLNIQ